MGLTTKEAIELRRSIRKYKTKDIPDEIIYELIDSARLAQFGGRLFFLYLVKSFDFVGS